MPPEQITITDFSSEGLGVGRLEPGQVAMIRGAVPGDTITPRFDKAKRKGVDVGEIEILAKPSEHRIEHPCPHYNEGCAGCRLGAYDYQAELHWKTEKVNQTLQRIGKMEIPSVRKIIPSPTQWNYRDRLDLRIELKNGCMDIGYFGAEGFVPIRNCKLALPCVSNSLSMVRKSLSNFSTDLDNSSFNLLIRDNGRGESVAIMVTNAVTKDYLDLLRQVISYGKFVGWEIRHGTKTALRYNSSNIIDKFGRNTIYMNIGPGVLRLPLYAFTQVNMYNSYRLRKIVTDIIPKNGKLLDLYGGYGAFAFEHVLRGKGKSYVMETDKQTVDAGRNFAKRQRLAVKFKSTNLRKTKESYYPNYKFNCTITDPPRKGLQNKVVKFLNIKGSKIVVYVSCSVAALARDIERLTSYTPEYFQPIDMFPNTPEIETIAVLRRKDNLEEVRVGDKT